MKFDQENDDSTQQTPTHLLKDSMNQSADSSTTFHTFDLDSNYGSIGRRFLAFLIDGLIILIPAAILNSMLPVIGGVALWFFYGPILESSEVRATIGKHLMGLQVADLSGRRITLKASLIRNAMKLVSAALLLVGFVFAFFTRRKQTLHDLLADTIVVYGRSETPIADAWVENTKATFQSASQAASQSASAATDSFTHSVSRSAQSEPKKKESKIEQLERLQALREKGALTEEEFNRAKGAILDDF